MSDEFSQELAEIYCRMERASQNWQDKGCIAGAKMFWNARTRWANTDFFAGAKWFFEEIYLKRQNCPHCGRDITKKCDSE